jgi:hypothetical protein
VKDTLTHAKTDCEWCHIAGNDMARPLDASVKYHTGGPNGTANAETCKTCHMGKNLQDSPFYSPGVIHESLSVSNCGKTCHNGVAGYPANDIHNVKFLPGTTLPKVTLGTKTVNPNNVTIQATIADTGKYLMMIAAAKYNVTDSSGVMQVDWTNMTTDANGYNSNREIVGTVIDTTGWAAGNYTINIKGMASGPNTDRNIPYAPLNGQWSLVVSTNFTKV